jgi:hypothetical protein
VNHRLLASLAVLSGLLTVWAVWDRALIAAPLAVAFVTAAFVWSILRPAPGAEQVCAGCPAGCVGCREHIDVE